MNSNILNKAKVEANARLDHQVEEILVSSTITGPTRHTIQYSSILSSQFYLCIKVVRQWISTNNGVLKQSFHKAVSRFRVINSSRLYIMRALYRGCNKRKQVIEIIVLRQFTITQSVLWLWKTDTYVMWYIFLKS